MKPEEQNINEGELFIADYNKIVLQTDSSVIVNSEWSKKGDYFVKLSIYDNSFVPIKTLGYTTLINNH